MLPVKSAADFSVFLQFGTWFGHMTADALQMLKVMGSKVMVMLSKQYYSVSVSHASLHTTVHEHVHVTVLLRIAI